MHNENHKLPLFKLLLLSLALFLIATQIWHSFNSPLWTDDAFFGTVAKNLASGNGYSSSDTRWNSAFSSYITAGPVIILPAALMIKIFGNQHWVLGLTITMLIWILLTMIFVAWRNAVNFSDDSRRNDSVLTGKPEKNDWRWAGSWFGHHVQKSFGNCLHHHFVNKFNKNNFWPKKSARKNPADYAFGHWFCCAVFNIRAGQNDFSGTKPRKEKCKRKNILLAWYCANCVFCFPRFVVDILFGLHQLPLFDRCFILLYFWHFLFDLLH